MDLDVIRRNAAELLASLPAGVALVAAGKTRRPEELRAAVEGGVQAIGHNYVQEAEASIAALGREIRWHFIGHLQRNKARKAARLFDRIETVDSLRLGEALDRACADVGKVMPVFVEVNSAGEQNKTGVVPDEAERLIRDLSGLGHLRIDGLMTMGPFSPDPEDTRPAFRLTRDLFEHLRALRLPGVELLNLSMGMSDSYLVAIEEGATMVRIGTRLFGPR